MLGVADESVGPRYSESALVAARNLALDVVEECARSVQPGMAENEARILINQIQEKKGAIKSWHPAQVRFGPNTVLPFGKAGVENPRLQQNDIFFFDIGPILNGHEGDVGRTFCIGNDAEMSRACDDVKAIWHAVRDVWIAKGLTGPKLYEFASYMARKQGWVLALEKANGHRIADFPHAAKARGSIEGFSQTPASNRWILEIQIRHPSRPFGAFFEDLLNKESDAL